MHYSNVQLLDPVTSNPVRAVWRYSADAETGELRKVRVARGRLATRNAVIPRPAPWRQPKAFAGAPLALAMTCCFVAGHDHI